MKAGHLTAQMRESQTTMLKVYDVVKTLLTLTDTGDCVDGETMQYILDRVGMEDQMLRQLIMTQPIEELKYMYEERRLFESFNNLSINK